MAGNIDFLKTIRFFSTLSDADIRKIDSVCEDERFEASHIIFSEGSYGDRFYMIMEGEVEIWKNYNNPDADLLSVFGAGQMFGEIALIDDLPRSATIIARTHVKLLSISKQSFEQIFFLTDSNASLSLMRSIASIVRKSNETFMEGLKAKNRHLEMAYEQLKQEIAERKHAEKEISMARDEWERTFNAIEDIVTIHDPQMRIVRMNRAAIKALGSTPESMIGKYCYEVFQRRSSPCNKCPMWSGVTIPQPAEIDNYVLYDRIFYVTLSPIFDDSGKFIGVVRTARDITRQKNLEAHVRRSQKMEAIGTLAGGIAHDFNNILMTIMMNTEFALKKWEENPLVRESLELSLKAACRARDLIDQILMFSRKSEQKNHPSDIATIVRESLKILRASLPKTIIINEEINVASGMVFADPAQIQQVLLNLLSNAVYAVRENGGIVTVKLSDETIDTGNQPDPDILPGLYLKLTVSDTGEGISDAVIDKIFDPFFTTKKPGEGSGMGLAVAVGIVERIGGVIRVTNRPEKGAVFDVFLPAYGKKE